MRHTMWFVSSLVNLDIDDEPNECREFLLENLELYKLVRFILLTNSNLHLAIKVSYSYGTKIGYNLYLFHKNLLPSDSTSTIQLLVDTLPRDAPSFDAFPVWEINLYSTTIQLSYLTENCASMKYEIKSTEGMSYFKDLFHLHFS